MTAHFFSDASPRRKAGFPFDVVILVAALAAVYAAAVGVSALQRVAFQPPERHPSYDVRTPAPEAPRAAPIVPVAPDIAPTAEPGVEASAADARAR